MSAITCSVLPSPLRHKGYSRCQGGATHCPGMTALVGRRDDVPAPRARYISSARMAPVAAALRIPVTHSYRKRTPSRWCGRNTLARYGSTTTSTTLAGLLCCPPTHTHTHATHIRTGAVLKKGECRCQCAHRSRSTYSQPCRLACSAVGRGMTMASGPLGSCRGWRLVLRSGAPGPAAVAPAVKGDLNAVADRTFQRRIGANAPPPRHIVQPHAAEN